VEVAVRRYLQLCVVVVTVLALASPAWAVPAKFTQQGRLLDLNGQPLTGTHALFFALYDAETGGVEEWFEYHSTVFDNGYYTVSLGEQIPLDEALFSGASLWLEISVDGTVLSPRQEVAAVPWALRASSAESIDGGAVDASNISIAGSEVINSSGAWVGPALTVDWNNIAGIPADLADGDQDSDSLGLLLCSEEQVAKWTSDAWACADDVDTVTSSLPWTSLTDIPTDIADGDQDTDTLAFLRLSCLDGQVPHYDLASDEWDCADDQDTPTTTLDWTAITGIPADIADGTDDILSEPQVEGYITNGALDLSGATTLNGNTILTSADPTLQSIQCAPGETLSASSSGWVCASLQALVDADGDSILAWDDCDDTDSAVGSNANDQDCDGIDAGQDCNDFDPASTTITEDADCDGTLTAADCDDTDATSTVIATDADCDGIVTALDCDDLESSTYPGATELCGDGIDNDCDNDVDEDCTSCLSSSWTIGSSWTQNNSSYESSQLPGSSYNATNTLDGNSSTFWLSNSGNLTNEWIIYNLGSTQQIQGLRISNGQHPFSMRNATLQISSSLSGPWTDVLDFTATSQDIVWQPFDGFVVSSQFFRLYMHDNYGSAHYIKLRDIEFDVCN